MTKSETLLAELKRLEDLKTQGFDEWVGPRTAEDWAAYIETAHLAYPITQGMLFKVYAEAISRAQAQARKAGRDEMWKEDNDKLIAMTKEAVKENRIKLTEAKEQGRREAIEEVIEIIFYSKSSSCPLDCRCKWAEEIGSILEKNKENEH